MIENVLAKDINGLEPRLTELQSELLGERQKVGGRATYSAVVIRNSGRNHQRRSQNRNAA